MLDGELPAGDVIHRDGADVAPGTAAVDKHGGADATEPLKPRRHIANRKHSVELTSSKKPCQLLDARQDEHMAQQDPSHKHQGEVSKPNSAEASEIDRCCTTTSGAFMIDSNAEPSGSRCGR